MKLKKFKEFILKQYDTGPWLGGLKQIYSYAMSYQGVLIAFLSLLTAYNTMMLRDELGYITQWFNFPVFVGVLGFLLFLAMVFVYKFEIPSVTRFSNLQGFKHHNLTRKLLEDMEKAHQKQFTKILKELEEVKRRLDKFGY